MKLIKSLLIGLLLTTASQVFAINFILSEKPIDVPLPINKEIIIKFPNAVTHTEIIDGKGEAALNSFLRPDGVLLLTAQEAFGKMRMVASMVDGKVVVLDLDAHTGAINYETISLAYPQIKKKPRSKPQAPTVNPHKPAFLQDGEAMTKNTPNAKHHQSVGYNDMVRFAFRHYIGPARLIGKDIAAKKVGIGVFSTKRFLRVWHQRLHIRPVSQWKIEGRYITVLLVNNLSNQSMDFDPRALRGRIEFAATLNARIEPQGNVHDQTLWAIITAVPFNQAML